MLAHPGLLNFSAKNRYFELINTLKDQGLQGLEVFCSTHSATDADLFYSIATELNMFITGGSDFHGVPKPSVKIGNFYGADKIFPS